MFSIREAPEGSQGPLGLGPRELTLLRLLHRRPMSRSEIRNRHPELDDDDIFNQLSEMRLIRTSGSLENFVANHPNAAAEAGLRELEGALAQQLESLVRARQDYARLADELDEAEDSRPVDDAEIIEPGDRLRDRCTELVNTAKSSIWLAMAGVQDLQAQVDEKQIVNLDHQLHALDVRHLCPHAVTRNPQHLEYLNRLRRRGGEVRTASTVPIGVLIVDERAAVILPRVARDEGAVILRQQTSVQFLTHIYENIWQSADELSEAEPGQVATTPITTAILKELARGHTDETIARRLGMSTRTLRRHLSKLTDQYGIQTRYQLGVLAERLFGIGDSTGWLRPHEARKDRSDT